MKKLTWSHVWGVATVLGFLSAAILSILLNDANTAKVQMRKKIHSLKNRSKDLKLNQKKLQVQKNKFVAELKKSEKARKLAEATLARKPFNSCNLDGLLEPGEVCEGGNLNGQSCKDLGFFSGTLSCAKNCQFDTTECVSFSRVPQCGDGQIDIGSGEQCDGTNLRGATCASFGYSGGTLSCTGICQLDTSKCHAGCGDGKIDVNSGEACDSANFNGKTCATFGYIGGTLSCSPATCEFDTSKCIK